MEPNEENFFNELYPLHKEVRTGIEKWDDKTVLPTPLPRPTRRILELCLIRGVGHPMLLSLWTGKEALYFGETYLH